MSITGILIAAACVGIVGIFVGLFLGVAGIKFKVEVDEKEEAVLAALPGNNCGGCGFAGCSGLAAAIAKGEAAVNTCPVGGEEVGKKIAAIMGVEAEASERKVAYVHCQGDCDRTKTDYDYYGIKDCRMMSFVPGGGPKSCNCGCLGYGTCTQVCPFDAIHVKNGVAVVDKEKCKACGKCVEVYSEIEWQSLRTLAKEQFSFNVSNGTATFDLGLGAIKRQNMCDKLYEVPAQNWADITDKNGKSGVSVISECKYGWDKFNDSTLRFTVLHTPKHNYRIDSMQSMMDLGLNRYSFAIFSHKGDVGTDTQLEARKFITPMTAYICKKHNGALGTNYSFGSVSSNDVIVRAIKKAENSDEIIIRLNEGANKTINKFSLSLGNGIEDAKEVFASEEYKGKAEIKDGKLITSFKPYEIKSFALKLKSGEKVKAEKAVPIELPLDKNIITKQGKCGDYDYTVPFEIVPDEINSNGYKFIINKNGNNALTASAQKINTGSKDSKIAFLCASLVGDKDAEFVINGREVKAKVNSCFERFARWDLYDFGETAYIKKGKIAYEATHCHKNGKDEIAKSMYFYIVEFDVPKNSTVIFPNDSDIVILAACSLYDGKATLAAPVYDEIQNNRPFTFKMSKKEKAEYILGKCVWNLNDKDEFIKANNRGKEE